MKNALFSTFLSLGLMTSSFSHLFADPDTEQRFQDIFITAGYATAFGAALGAASLAFQSQPENHLQHIAVGASLGFIGGSLMGSYVVFSPILVESADHEKPSLLASQLRRPSGEPMLNIFPMVDSRTLAFNGFAAGWAVANF